MGNERVFIAAYMMTNAANGTLYIGVTSDLYRRVEQHCNESLGDFTKRYGLKRLVWLEQFEVMTDAIRREKSLKRYPRAWKINLIERDNPHWEDLSLQWDRTPRWRHDP